MSNTVESDGSSNPTPPTIERLPDEHQAAETSRPFNQNPSSVAMTDTRGPASASPSAARRAISARSSKQIGRPSPPQKERRHEMPSRRDPLMTVNQLAERWQVSERTIRRMIADGRLPVVRIGRAVRIPGKAVER